MDTAKLTGEEKLYLLGAARQSLEQGVRQVKRPALDQTAVPPRLLEPGASFVTLTVNGELRGCVGALEPHQPLIKDVQEHALAAALQDYRFPPVQPDELGRIKIEISCLSVPQPLEYGTPDELLTRLCPHLDGVVLRDPFRRATFLPQVWEKIPEPSEFLDNLCYKMGAPQGEWRRVHFDVFIYRVEEFHE